MDKIYRFRGTSALLDEDDGKGFEELEKQQIYFATSDALNDPIEGLRKVYWDGDKVIWSNFIKNYSLVLTNLFIQHEISGNTHKLEVEHIDVFLNSLHLPTPQYRELANKIASRVLRSWSVRTVVNMLSMRQSRIYREELAFFLSSIHTTILHIIAKSIASQQLPASQVRGFPKPKLRKQLKQLSYPRKILKSRLPSNVEAEAMRDFSQKYEMELLSKQLSQEFFDQALHNDNTVLLVSLFPKLYIERLELLAFPSWSTACFMESYRDSAIWGYYAQEHRGCGLIFNVEDNALRLYEAPGTSPNEGRLFQFYKVDYDSGIGEIDFFRMLGQLPMKDIEEFWMTHDGKVSKCADFLAIDSKDFHSMYWDTYRQGITRKTRHWENEREHRLIFDHTFIDASDKDTRTLRYNFTSLRGIIFGIKTTEQNKYKILKIIREKCKQHNRTDFEFYQAYYESKTDSIQKYRLNLSLVS